MNAPDDPQRPTLRRELVTLTVFLLLAGVLALLGFVLFLWGLRQL